MTPLTRHEFPVCARLRYFNHAGVAPLPRRSAAALARYADAMRDYGGSAGEVHEAREPEVRQAAAALMGVPAEDVAFVKNTTEGLSLVASGLDWRPGDRVIVPECEFPANLFPWLAQADRGVVVDRLPTGPDGIAPLELFDEALRRGGARVVAVSWVQYGRGFRTDLAALSKVCHRHGALLCVDAIQGLGVIPAELAAWGVDVAAADGHKFMLGPEGLGLAYVRAERRAELRVQQPGWNCVPHRGDWDNLSLRFDDSARRFEGGTPNRAAILALGESLDLLLETGVERVWAHVDGLCQRLVAGLAEVSRAEVLSDRSTAARSAIVTFSVAGMPSEQTCDLLTKQGFAVAPRGGGVRVSPHGYNTEAEIDRLVAAVAALC